MACSTILFVTYLDFLLKSVGLLNHELMAYADDLIFFAKDYSETKEIITKLEALAPFLEINKVKSALMEVGL